MTIAMNQSIDMRFMFKPDILNLLKSLDLPYINDYMWRIIPYEVEIDLSIPSQVLNELTDEELVEDYLGIPIHMLESIEDLGTSIN